MKQLRNLGLLAGIFWLAHVNDVVQACAACSSRSDSPMAQGMNAGILALLGVVATVLCGAATFFVFLARRASHLEKSKEPLNNQ